MQDIHLKDPGNGPYITTTNIYGTLELPWHDHYLDTRDLKLR